MRVPPLARALHGALVGALACAIAVTTALPARAGWNVPTPRPDFSPADERADGLTNGRARGAEYALTQQAVVPASPATARSKATFRRGLAALKNNRTAEALAAHDALPADALERRVLGWRIALAAPGVSPARLVALMGDVPNWPGQISMRTRLERAIVVRKPSDADLLVAFSAASPRTDAGRLALAGAKLATGEREAARALVAQVWREADLDRSSERAVLRRFGKLITRDDHRARVSRLLAKRRVKGAARIASRAGHERLVAAVGAVARKRRDAARKLDRVPRSERDSAAYGAYLSQYRRRKGRLKDAAQALAAIRTIRSDEMGDRAAREAQRLAIELVRSGASATAYEVAALPLGRSATRRARSAFLAGWIALRFRNAPGVALKHFAALDEVAERPATKARAQYWIGRTHEALGAKAKARAAFTRAAGHRAVFYGQLAAERIGRKALGVNRAGASAGDRTRFAAYEFVRAIALLEEAGEPRLAHSLYRALAQRLESPGELALLAARAERVRGHDFGLYIGRLAANRGLDVPALSHPLGAVTGSVPMSKPDLALAYAVARQESSFRAAARSRAGALGMMQVLPGTAREVTRRLGLPYVKSRLTRDPAYNVRIGTAYLERWRGLLDGSLPLALVAYNAGPTRARNWSKSHGSPATMSVDRAVDWVEMIPFTETRDYVHKVMANHQVYRSRLMDAPLSLGRMLTKD